MSISFSKLVRRLAPLAAVCGLVVAMDGTWATAEPAIAPAPRVASAAGADAPAGSGHALSRSSTEKAPAGASTEKAPAGADAATDEPDRERGGEKTRRGAATITGKLNLNTATEEQLMLLPTVGPAKAERIVAWRKKNGGFKRIADLRRVKGFGYKTFKRLEPYLDITGETTLAVTR